MAVGSRCSFAGGCENGLQSKKWMKKRENGKCRGKGRREAFIARWCALGVSPRRDEKEEGPKRQKGSASDGTESEHSGLRKGGKRSEWHTNREEKRGPNLHFKCFESGFIYIFLVATTEGEILRASRVIRENREGRPSGNLAETALPAAPWRPKKNTKNDSKSIEKKGYKSY